MEGIERQIRTILRERFGLEEFRPGQLESILHLMNERSVLCIQPTGFGKSLLYQLPSLLLPGITIVISPLLALMRDQLTHLNQRFRIPADTINSDQTDEENGIARFRAQQGELKVLFVAPEQLDHMDRFEFLLNLPVSLLVVDEAHCISTWGHDFRPSYRQIVHFTKAVLGKNPEVRVLGLTATANGETEKDIIEQLGPKKVIRMGMNRPNLSLSVFPVSSLESKLSLCLHLMKQLEGAGIIYCATRENCEIVADFLVEQGVNAVAYHAGFPPEEKRALQAAFIDDRYKVCAATNALGMGIDKPNIRFIIHFDFPGSITAYYQEVGRAGRDGRPALGILLYDKGDYRIQKYFIDSSLPKQEDFEAVLEAVQNGTEAPNLLTIKRKSGLHPTRVQVVISELVEQGFLRKKTLEGKQVYVPTGKQEIPELTRYERQYSVKMRELNGITHYAALSSGCYMELLRKALGDSQTQTCGHCGLCKSTTIRFLESPEANDRIAGWLAKRVMVIPAVKTQNLAEGVALLDAKNRLPIVIDFFKNRARSSLEEPGVSEELLILLETHAKKIAAKGKVSCVVPIPSRTWGGRDAVVQLLGKCLGVPAFPNLLKWREMPLKRQGELLNNDQRRYNVHSLMTVDSTARLPPGRVILFDDYTGSGATLREAARALRKEQGVSQVIVPFTIAQVKWKLGSPGMV